MPKQIIRYSILIIILLAGFAVQSKAQFKEDAFSQSYNEKNGTAKQDTAATFSIKEYFGGLAHKNTMKIGTMFAGSVILPGTAQIYNKDYWKLPIVYGGIGALAGTGGYFMNKYNQSQRQYDAWNQAKIEFETNDPNTPYPIEAPFVDTKAKTTGTWLMAGAGLMYWASLLDGVISYDSDREPLPGRATLYSVLLPGLGQIYNGELFKVPIYWGGLMVSIQFLSNNNTNYQRFRRIYNEATNDPDYSQSISAETAKWYRDVYRRYRDYSILATALVYLLQVIDANVFAYMHDFEVNDEISMNIEPAVISPYNAYAINTPQYNTAGNAFGMRIGFRF